ncbi:MAG: TonB family protein [Candidatus Binatia bacterium]
MVSTLVSTCLHAGLLLLFAATSIHIASEEHSSIIPLVIRDPAPPPPPPPPGPGTGNGPAAPAEAVVAPADPVKPIEIPKPIEKPKVAAKPKPFEKPKVIAKPKAPAAPPTPASLAAPLPSEAPAGGGIAGGVAGGTIGGTVGGVRGGQVGGRLGGTGDKVWAFDKVAVPPRVVHREAPEYPRMARQRRLEGVVIVRAVVDRSGVVEAEGLRVVDSNPPFDDAALAAVRLWRFQPGRDAQGQLVRVSFEVPIRFVLR